MLHDHDVEAPRNARHGALFSVLGMRADAQGALWVRAFLPGAVGVAVFEHPGGRLLATLAQRHADGPFDDRLKIRKPRDYRLEVDWADGSRATIDDPQ